MENASSQLWQNLAEVLGDDIDKLSADVGSSSSTIHVPLKLDLVPALTQLMLDTGAMRRNHVWYQSSMRLLLGALGLADRIPAGAHDNLLRFCSKLSTRDLHLLHGQGAAHDAQAIGGGASRAPPADPAEFLARNNFGAFVKRTVIRHGPAHPAADEDVVLPDVLNLFAAARKHSHGASWAPRGGAHKKNIALVLTLDGMALRVGADLQEQTGEVWGFSTRVGLEDVREYLNSGEAEQERWRRDHPWIDEAIEVMGAVADYSVLGHVGFWLQPKGLDSSDVASRVAPFVRKVGHVCEGCMLWGFENDARWDEIMARCDLHCCEYVLALYPLALVCPCSGTRRAFYPISSHSP